MFKVLGYLLEFRNRASKGLIEVRKDFLALSKVIRDTSKDLKDFKDRIAGTFDELAESAKKTAKLTRENYSKAYQHRSWIGRMWGRLDKGMRASLASLTKSFLTFAAVAAGIVAVIKSGMTLENVLRDIRAQGGYAAKEMEGFRKTLIPLSRELYRPFKDIGRMMVTLAKRSGMAKEEMIPIIRASFKLGKIFSVNEELFSRWFVKAKALYGMQAKDVGMWGNVIRVGAQEGYASVEQLMYGIEGMNEALMLVGKNVKTEMIPSMITGISMMAKVFEDQPQQLNKMMISLADPSSPYFQKIYAFLKFFGGEAADLAKAAAKEMDLAKFMKILVNITKLGSKDLRTKLRIKSAMEETLGFEYARVEAMARLDPKKFDSMMESLRKAALESGGLAKYFTSVLTTSDHLKNAWYELSRQIAPIGHDFLEALTESIKLLTKALGLITDVYTKIKDIINALADPAGLDRAAKTWGKLLRGEIYGWSKDIWKDFKDSWKFVTGREFKPHIPGMLDPKGAFYRPEKEAAARGRAEQTGRLREKAFLMEAYKDMMAGRITNMDYLNLIRAQQDREKAGREKKQRGGIIFPRPGGVDVTVAEAGRPEVIADPLMLKRLVGSQEIVSAIWGSAHFLADRLKQVEKDRIEVTPRPVNITPTPFDPESSSYAF